MLPLRRLSTHQSPLLFGYQISDTKNCYSSSHSRAFTRRRNPATTRKTSEVNRDAANTAYFLDSGWSLATFVQHCLLSAIPRRRHLRRRRLQLPTDSNLLKTQNCYRKQETADYLKKQLLSDFRNSSECYKACVCLSVCMCDICIFWLNA